MSKRLQVLLKEGEFEAIRALAAQEHVTVAAWVRRALNAARRREPVGDPARKIAAIRAGARHSFPTADIDTMLAEIACGAAAGPAVPTPGVEPSGRQL